MNLLDYVLQDATDVSIECPFCVRKFPHTLRITSNGIGAGTTATGHCRRCRWSGDLIPFLMASKFMKFEDARKIAEN